MPLDDHAIDVMIGRSATRPSSASSRTRAGRIGRRRRPGGARRRTAQLIRQAVDGAAPACRIDRAGAAGARRFGGSDDARHDAVAHQHARQQTGGRCRPRRRPRSWSGFRTAPSPSSSRDRWWPSSGATERLALAFGALVPDTDRKSSLLDMARANAAAVAGRGRHGLRRHVAQRGRHAHARTRTRTTSRMSTGASCRGRGRGRSTSRPSPTTHPNRVQAWLTSVDVRGVRELDLALIRDLLRREQSGGLAGHGVGRSRRNRTPDVGGRFRSRAGSAGGAGRSAATRDVRPCARPPPPSRAARRPARSSRHIVDTPPPRRRCGRGSLTACARRLARRSYGRSPSPWQSRRTHARSGACASCCSASAPPAASRSRRSSTRPIRPCAGRRSICFACSAATRRCPSSPRCSTTPIRRCSASRSAPSSRSAPKRRSPCSSRRSSGGDAARRDARSCSS